MLGTCRPSNQCLEFGALHVSKMQSAQIPQNKNFGNLALRSPEHNRERFEMCWCPSRGWRSDHRFNYCHILHLIFILKAKSRRQFLMMSEQSQLGFGLRQ